MTDFTDAKETIHCQSCGLCQFTTHRGVAGRELVAECRRCHKPFVAAPSSPVAPSTVKPMPLTLMAAIGPAVRLLRLAAGYSQRDLAGRYFPAESYQRKGVRVPSRARTYISRVENGYHTPTLPTIPRLADALGVTVYEIIRLAEIIHENYPCS